MHRVSKALVRRDCCYDGKRSNVLLRCESAEYVWTRCGQQSKGVVACQQALPITQREYRELTVRLGRTVTSAARPSPPVRKRR